MGLKSALRKMAVTRNGATVTMIPLLNDPTATVALPCRYRDEMLAKYGASLATLRRENPLFAIFVKEGLLIGFFHESEKGEQFILHGLDLRDDKDIEIVGSEVYAKWQAFPSKKLLSYDQLQKNWRKIVKSVAEMS